MCRFWDASPLHVTKSSMDLVTRKAGSLTTRGPTRTSPSSTNLDASLTDGAIFSLSCIAILPLAALLGDATEQLALHTNEVGGRGALSPHRPAPRAPAPPLTRRGAASGQTLGGLLNATFGNATELIVSFFLLLEGELDVVKVSLLGAARALRDEAPPPLAPPHLAGRGLRHALGLWRAVPAR